EAAGATLELLVDVGILDLAGEGEDVVAGAGGDEVGGVAAVLAEDGMEGELLGLAAAEGDLDLEGLVEPGDRLLGVEGGDLEVDAVELVDDGGLPGPADDELVLAGDGALLVGQGGEWQR